MMLTVLNYAKSIFIFEAAALPIYLIYRLIAYKVKDKMLHWKRELAISLFTFTLIAILTQTLIPPEFFNGNISLSAYHFPMKNQIYLNPAMMFKWLYLLYQFKNLTGFLVNYVGNIVLFIPLGFLYPIIWKQKKDKTLLFGFLLSVSIEFCQLFMNRTTDIGDVILNTFGTFLGFLLYKWYMKHKEKGVSR